MKLLLEDGVSSLLLENTTDSLLLEDAYMRGYKRRRRVVVHYHDETLENTFGIDIDNSYEALLPKTTYA